MHLSREEKRPGISRSADTLLRKQSLGTVPSRMTKPPRVNGIGQKYRSLQTNQFFNRENGDRERLLFFQRMGANLCAPCICA